MRKKYSTQLRLARRIRQRRYKAKMDRKQIIDELVKTKFPNPEFSSRARIFRDELEAQPDSFLKAAFRSLSEPKISAPPESKTVKLKKSEQEPPAIEKVKCPTCGYSCQRSVQFPEKFFCGYCTDIQGQKVYFSK